MCNKGVALVVELSEPIRTAVTTLHGLELKAASKLLKVEDDQGKGDRKEQLLSFLQLVRWLQLYIVGDAENAEPELAEELSEVYKAAFAKGKSCLRLCCLLACNLLPLTIYRMMLIPSSTRNLWERTLLKLWLRRQGCKSAS